MIVTPDDFVDEINIPNTDEKPVSSSLTRYIAKYEAKLLEQLLGPQMYDELTIALKMETPPKIWTDIRDSVKPAIANYVFYYFTQAGIVYNSGTGAKKTNSDSSVNVSAWGLMVSAWNEMVSINFKTQIFIKKNLNIYLSFNAEDYSGYYINDWFDEEDYYYSTGRVAKEIFRYKNTMDL